jgi:predicted Na+-dependent transporter
MTNDQKSTITGAIIAIGAAIAVFFPQAGPVIQSIASAVAIIAVTMLGYYTNKPE